MWKLRSSIINIVGSPQTNLFNGVTEAMVFEGAEEECTLLVVDGLKRSLVVSILELGNNHQKGGKMSSNKFYCLKQIHKILPGFCAMLWTSPNLHFVDYLLKQLVVGNSSTHYFPQNREIWLLFDRLDLLT